MKGRVLSRLKTPTRLIDHSVVLYERESTLWLERKVCFQDVGRALVKHTTCFRWLQISVFRPIGDWDKISRGTNVIMQTRDSDLRTDMGKLIIISPTHILLYPLQFSHRLFDGCLRMEYHNIRRSSLASPLLAKNVSRGWFFKFNHGDR